VPISPLVYLNRYISAMIKSHMNLATKSTMFNRGSSIMTHAPVLTVWMRCWCLLPFKPGTMLTVQKFSTDYPLPMNGEIHSESTSYRCSIVRKYHFSTLCHRRCIICEERFSTEFAEVSNEPHSEIHQLISEFPTLDSYSICKLKCTWDTNLVDRYSDAIRMY